MIKYVCDRCGKEISENERFNVKVCKEGSPTYYHPTDWNSKDLCQDCADRIVRMTYRKVATKNTNLDQLREMPAEELAEKIHSTCVCCIYNEIVGQDLCCDRGCKSGTIEWLNQEVFE